MAFKLSRYEDQAKLSLYLGVLGMACVLVIAVLFQQRFDRVTFFVSFNPNRPFLPVVGAGLALGLAAGVIGFFVALNSAGQKRNTRSKLAWQSFFLNALVITLILCAAIFLFYTRNPLLPIQKMTIER